MLTIYALSKSNAMRVVCDSIVYVAGSCFGGSGMPYSIRSPGWQSVSFFIVRV